MTDEQLSPEVEAGIRAINDGVWVCHAKKPFIVREVRNWGNENAPEGSECPKHSQGDCAFGGKCVPRIDMRIVVPKDKNAYVEGIPLAVLRGEQQAQPRSRSGRSYRSKNLI